MSSENHNYTFADPGHWGREHNSNAKVRKNDVFQVTQGDADTNHSYTAGDYYTANFEGTIDNRYYPAHGTSNDNWVYVDLNIIENGKGIYEYKKSDKYDGHEHHINLTDEQYTRIKKYAGESLDPKKLLSASVSVLGILATLFPETFTLLPVAVTGGVIIAITCSLTVFSHLNRSKGLKIVMPQVAPNKATLTFN